ncbi:MAG TPA: family 16 glycoside hydrolase [Candidatus Acidoferrales bacterium]|nr:family 16 glycoside hydrolase [Candidatus Acidoferrales bacterium]
MKRTHTGSIAASLIPAAILAAGFLAFAQTAKTIRIDVDKEKTGAEPTHFLPIVGNWIVATSGGKNILMVDGRQWKRGDPSGGLADKARLIYGSKHEDFIDNVKAFAYFPYAVAQGVDDFKNGEIAMRFQIVEGALDQCAGILFNVKPNGDYLTVRFNGKEDNLVLWTFNKGTRKFVKKGSEDMPLKTREWYSMKIAVQGTRLESYLNGKLLLQYTLPEAVSGKVGVWSKTDSVSYFDDYTVTPAP